MSPLPPMTTIFILLPSFIFLAEAFQAPVVLTRTEHHIVVTPSCGYNFHTVIFLSSSGRGSKPAVVLTKTEHRQARPFMKVATMFMSLAGTQAVPSRQNSLCF